MLDCYLEAAGLRWGGEGGWWASEAAPLLPSFYLVKESGADSVEHFNRKPRKITNPVLRFWWVSPNHALRVVGFSISQGMEVRKPQRQGRGWCDEMCMHPTLLTQPPHWESNHRLVFLHLTIFVMNIYIFSKQIG